MTALEKDNQRFPFSLNNFWGYPGLHFAENQVLVLQGMELRVRDARAGRMGAPRSTPGCDTAPKEKALGKACSLDWFKVGVHKVCAAPSLSWAVHEIDNAFFLHHCFEVDCHCTLMLTLYLLLISARDAHLSLVMPPVSPETSCCFGPIDLDLTYVRNFGLHNLFPELLGVLPRCRLCAYYYFQRNVLYL